MIYLVVYLALAHGYMEATLEKFTFDTAAECEKFKGTEAFTQELKELGEMLHVDVNKVEWEAKCKPTKGRSI